MNLEYFSENINFYGISTTVATRKEADFKVPAYTRGCFLLMYCQRSVKGAAVAKPRVAAKPTVVKPNGDCNNQMFLSALMQ